MGFIYIFRAVILVLALILTIPSLGLIAHWTQGSLADNTTYSFEPMGLFTAALTLITIPIMLILPEVRKNAFALYIVSELTIFGLLWIFWVVAAALAIQHQQDFYPLGNCTRLAKITVHWCNEMFAIVGLVVVVFVLIMLYTLVLSIYALVQTFRIGGRVWFQSVKEIKISVPITHHPGDLESKARRDESTTSIPMTSYPTPVPSNPQYNAPLPVPQQYSYRQQSSRSAYSAPSNDSPSQVAMKVTTAANSRLMQQSLYNPSIAQV